MCVGNTEHVCQSGKGTNYFETSLPVCMCASFVLGQAGCSGQVLNLSHQGWSSACKGEKEASWEPSGTLPTRFHHI